MRNSGDSIMIDGFKTKMLFTKAELQEMVVKVAYKMILAYSGKLARGEKLAVVIVLNGAMPFAVDVLRAAKLQVETYTIKANSYDGIVRSEPFLSGMDFVFGKLEGTHVLIIEDIVDTGRTVKAVKEAIVSRHNPKSCKIMTLLNKPSKREVDVSVDFAAAEVDDVFVVGYGMDYKEQGRWMDCIVQLEGGDERT